MDINEIATKADILRLESLLTELLKSRKSASEEVVDSDYYNSNDVCKILNITESTLRTWRCLGKIPYYNLRAGSRKSYYKKSEIDEMIKNGVKHKSNMELEQEACSYIAKKSKIKSK